MEEVKQIIEKQEQIYQHNQRFHAQVWKEQEKLATEVQDIRRGQMTQLAANNQRFEAERNLQLALERQGREIAEIRRQVNLWNNNVSSKEAYACWAQQQANPNLSEVLVTQILDIMQTNLEKGRPLFHGFLKSDYGASSSSQVDPEEPVPLRTAPPSPHFQKMKKGSLRSKKEGNWSILPEPPLTPRRPEQQPWSSSPTPRRGHQCLGIPSPPQGQVIHA
ncbi:hypothetical protein PIB30_091471 [Stylosanthes scabra]|uniref:Uncharacterized protein n=1 Tax=Stylosanthes scabra TaxID=79078 RepID=A0ABU6WUN1_9FABA|nr:hypothetical protein [Stylosanthes scabra]